MISRKMFFSIVSSYQRDDFLFVPLCEFAEFIGADAFIHQMGDDKSRFYKHGKPVDHRFILSNIALNSPKQNIIYYRAIDKRRPIKGASV